MHHLSFLPTVIRSGTALKGSVLCTVSGRCCVAREWLYPKFITFCSWGRRIWAYLCGQLKVVTRPYQGSSLLWLMVQTFSSLKRKMHPSFDLNKLLELLAVWADCFDAHSRCVSSLAHWSSQGEERLDCLFSTNIETRSFLPAPWSIEVIT